MDAPIVIIDTMPNNQENLELSVMRMSLSETVSMLENADEVLIGLHNADGFSAGFSKLLPELSLAALDGYHRNVESYCTWLVVDIESATITYVCIA